MTALDELLRELRADPENPFSIERFERYRAPRRCRQCAAVLEPSRRPGRPRIYCDRSCADLAGAIRRYLKKEAT